LISTALLARPMRCAWKWSSAAVFLPPQSAHFVIAEATDTVLGLLTRMAGWSPLRADASFCALIPASPGRR
jgi:hypothetical protein